MSRNPLLAPIERNGVAILDGGLGSEFEARGQDLSDALWSARLLRDDPELVADVHRDFVTAGADCIVSASYQANFAGFAAAGIERAEAESLMARSVELAVAARGDGNTIVGASVGPYGGALADGSEFTGDYDLDEKQLHDWHHDRFHVLAGAGADMIACETVPSFAEARALAALIDATSELWGWISFSCRDGEHISDGTPIRECAAFLDDVERIAGIGINCTAPRHVDDLLRQLAAATTKPILVYPNIGQTWDPATKQWLGGCSETNVINSCGRWRDLGARVIGGCCGTRPSDIRRMRNQLIT